jgi:hypothetical protein
VEIVSTTFIAVKQACSSEEGSRLFQKLMDLWEQTQWHNQKITMLFLSSVPYSVLTSVSLATVSGYIFKEKCSEVGHFRVKESNWKKNWFSFYIKKVLPDCNTDWLYVVERFGRNIHYLIVVTNDTRKLVILVQFFSTGTRIYDLTSPKRVKYLHMNGCWNLKFRSSLFAFFFQAHGKYIISNIVVNLHQEVPC